MTYSGHNMQSQAFFPLSIQDRELEYEWERNLGQPIFDGQILQECRIHVIFRARIDRLLQRL